MRRGGDAARLSRGAWGRDVLRILDRLEEIIIASLMGAATILIFISVVHRFGTDVPFLYPYLFPIHLSWAQELCIYMFIWMAKFGAAYGVRTGIHVGVDVLINRLNPTLAQGRHPVRPARRRAVHRHRRHHGREIRHRADEHRPGIARSRIAELDRLRLHSARLLSDVLPLPAGVLGVTGRPANCRITTRPMSTASKYQSRKRRSRSEKRDERRPDLRSAVRPDADGHADLDFARPDRLDLPVHDDRSADRERRPEAVFRPRQFRHHGDPVFHPRRHLPDPRRRGAAHDRVHDLGGRPFATAGSALPASRPARCSPRFPAPASRPWWRSARS